ncbi:hypothetical protein [Nonomuraea sp. LPB2021202275-12-8]
MIVRIEGQRVGGHRVAAARIGNLPQLIERGLAYSPGNYWR